jgi:hypothetical protein
MVIFSSIPQTISSWTEAHLWGTKRRQHPPRSDVWTTQFCQPREKLYFSSFLGLTVGMIMMTMTDDTGKMNRGFYNDEKITY